MFHQWISTDTPEEDMCTGCGVVAPDRGEGAVSDHGPIPIFCPGPEVKEPHYFWRGPGGDLSCHYCRYKVTSDTMPNEMKWECPPQVS